MTIPTPEQAQRKAAVLVDRARALVANPDDDAVRHAMWTAAFNLDWLAAGIVALADTPAPQPKD